MTQQTISEVREALSDGVIDGLTGTEARALLKQARDAHLSDLETIARVAHEEADRRSYCSIYDDIFAAVAEQTTVALPTRAQKRDHLVRVDVTYPVQIYVSAVDEEAAKEEAIAALPRTSNYLLDDYGVNGGNAARSAAVLTAVSAEAV